MRLSFIVTLEQCGSAINKRQDSREGWKLFVAQRNNLDHVSGIVFVLLLLRVFAIQQCEG